MFKVVFSRFHLVSLNDALLWVTRGSPLRGTGSHYLLFAQIWSPKFKHLGMPEITTGAKKNSRLVAPGKIKPVSEMNKAINENTHPAARSTPPMISTRK
jgi:hypothetical protein